MANVNFAKTGMGLLEIAIVFGEPVRMYVICIHIYFVLINPLYIRMLLYTHTTHKHTLYPKLNLKP